MREEELKDLISAQLGGDLKGLSTETEPMSVWVSPSSIVKSLTVARDHPDLKFLQLIDIAGIDYPEKEPRFELTYHLLSHAKNLRLMVKTRVDATAMVPSVVNVFPNADWYEREVWDLFGIAFENHPDLRRILCDYNFSGHALRKDFPLSGYSEVFFNPETHRVEYKPVNLEQPFRDFDFLSPWEGKWDTLLKTEEEAYK